MPSAKTEMEQMRINNKAFMFSLSLIAERGNFPTTDLATAVSVCVLA